ncbi:hypothetical protein QWZ13_11610 [Reinekea marina]|uniref:hypothetical protein n=1 Tax=Reinekea marina TaxID=1310421 RepID=UPI0025B51538|nr:hypothetical protein [Reinekea marina]MDN3649562.1 hypothetical protein [Reinekea marina]
MHIPGASVICSECSSLLMLDPEDNLLVEGTVNLVLVALMGLSAFYFGNLFVGIGVFICWRVLRVYIRTKGKIVVVT